MRVALELTVLELDRAGTARAIDQLLPRLEADPSIDLVRLRQAGRAPKSRIGRIGRGLSRELVYMPQLLPRRVAANDVDVLHCPSTLVPSRSPVPMVVTIYDALGWDHPEWLTRAYVLQLTKRLPKAIAAGAHVITSSEYSRGRIASSLKIDEERISVVPLGIDSRFNGADDPEDGNLISEMAISDKFILTVGTLQPRKNLEAALSAFEALGDDAAEHELVIAGAHGWGVNELLARIDSSQAASRIHLTGRVSDRQLLALYRRADVFLFPSRYEGFGFPPLEAMACGTPVVSNNRTSLAEVVGDAGIPIDPDNVDEIADALKSVLTNGELRRTLVEKGLAHAAKFTWERCAEETVDVYRMVASG